MAVERELVEMARRGNEQAFEAIVRLSADRLYAVAYRILRDADAADDAMQEAIVEAWKDLAMLRDADHLDAWLNRVVVRSCYRSLRRDRSHQERIRHIRPDTAGGEVDFVRIAERDELAEPFRRLSGEHRAVVVLRFYLGLSLPEIAETIGIPLGTAASRLHYALREMRASVEADDRKVVAMRPRA